MPRPRATTRTRVKQVLTGLVVGVLAAVVAVFGLGLLTADQSAPTATTYSLSNEDAIGPGPVSLIRVRDVREPSSIPGLAAPTGGRYVSLVVALERDEATAEQWFPLEDLTLALYAVDGDGRRTELIPTDSGQRMLEGIGGRVRGIDPYWIRLDYAPPAGDVDQYEVDLGVSGEEHAHTARTRDAQ